MGGIKGAVKSIGKDARTPEKPVKCHVPNPLFFSITFGGSKAVPWFILSVSKLV
jgi:hypothetical protein